MKKIKDSKSTQFLWLFGKRIPRFQNCVAACDQIVLVTFHRSSSLKGFPSKRVLYHFGLLLCTEGGDEQIELLQLDKAGIKVAQYMTELPPREVLQRQIQKSLEIAKARFENLIEEE